MHIVLQQKPSLKETIHNPYFANLSQNDCVEAIIKDIEDEVFWKVIYCLLCAVFPTLKGYTMIPKSLQWKIFFLVKQVDDTLLDSQLLFDDQDLFGSMWGVILSYCKEELDEVFEETNTERNDDLLR